MGIQIIFMSTFCFVCIALFFGVNGWRRLGKAWFLFLYFIVKLLSGGAFVHIK